MEHTSDSNEELSRKPHQIGYNIDMDKKHLKGNKL